MERTVNKWKLIAAKTAIAATKGVINTLVPHHCSLCNQIVDRGFCQPCQKLLPWIKECCKICGSATAQSEICGKCIKQKRQFNHSVIPFRYEPPISAFIHQFKYQGKRHHGPDLANTLAQIVLEKNTPLPDVILPVPLHKSRFKQRGFNQAEELAKYVGTVLNVHTDFTLIQRTRNTKSQVDLDTVARKRNVSGAFTVHEQRKYRSVALVDDVVTSGSTIHAICTELQKHGYNDIQIWAIAKTVI